MVKTVVTTTSVAFAITKSILLVKIPEKKKSFWNLKGLPILAVLA